MEEVEMELAEMFRTANAEEMNEGPPKVFST
jgi:hypothetical protein